MDEQARQSRRLDTLTWAFVGLGVVLRLVRYAMNFPLWGDESFVAVNFIARGYRDLLRPLDYGQICPLLFLWIERWVVVHLGFSEWTLRLFPLVCGVSSVFLFRHVAGCVVGGLPLLLAVAIFAVSFHPIRHAAEVKPYASDLLVALVLAGPGARMAALARSDGLALAAGRVRAGRAGAVAPGVVRRRGGEPGPGRAGLEAAAMGRVAPVPRCFSWRWPGRSSGCSPSPPGSRSRSR